jgi:hypothetical protein
MSINKTHPLGCNSINAGRPDFSKFRVEALNIADAEVIAKNHDYIGLDIARESHAIVERRKNGNQQDNHRSHDLKLPRFDATQTPLCARHSKISNGSGSDRITIAPEKPRAMFCERDQTNYGISLSPTSDYKATGFPEAADS